jgi:exosortase C (VPDSG-CTERM-specific)
VNADPFHLTPSRRMQQRNPALKPPILPRAIGASQSEERPPFPRLLWLCLGALFVGFGAPLYQLVRFALNSSLYSYILIIPFISLYILRLNRNELVFTSSGPRRAESLAFLLAGAFSLSTHLVFRATSATRATEDALALITAAFLLFLVGVCAWFAARETMPRLRFPLLFLFFMVPLPVAALRGIETMMQYGSAAVAKVLLHISGTPFFYDHLVFQLPGISLHVAPECSGIRSTVVLLIVSVVTGYFLLRSPVNRVLLVAVVLPLALLRNGFRIFVIGELCAHYGPQMIDSFIHRRGGPLFFGLSLVPFFVLVVLLQRREGRTSR